MNTGDYPTDYEFELGSNPENSWFVSQYYERRFLDRWQSDVVKIHTPGSTRVDILDAHYTSASDLGECHDTDSGGMAAMEGAFVTNANGPIRSIRSYLGAKSAAYTQRTHVFYQKREDIIDNVRVHPTNGVQDVFDYTKIDKNGDDRDDERWILRLERGGTAIVDEWDKDADGEVDARWTSTYEGRDRLETEQYDEGADGTVDALRITNSDYSARADFPTAMWICDIIKIETDIDGDGTFDEIRRVEYYDGKVVA